jgi:hypothetical protein
MGTTALFAELVVGGLLTLTWIILFALAALGIDRAIPTWTTSPLVVGFLLAVAYALGVVFDRLWDWTLDVTGLQKWVRTRPKGAVDTDLDRQRRRVFGADPKVAAEFINYHRSRMRVARASLFNFALITAGGLTLVGVRFGGVWTTEFATIGILGALLTIASVLALKNLGRTHDRVLEIVSAEDDNASTTVPPSAAPKA